MGALWLLTTPCLLTSESEQLAMAFKLIELITIPLGQITNSQLSPPATSPNSIGHTDGHGALTTTVSVTTLLAVSITDTDRELVWVT